MGRGWWGLGSGLLGVPGGQWVGEYGVVGVQGVGG